MEIRYEAPTVREDLTAAHARYWRRLGRPGANWSGAERVAVARAIGEARHRARDSEPTCTPGPGNRDTGEVASPQLPIRLTPTENGTSARAISTAAPRNGAPGR